MPAHAVTNHALLRYLERGCGLDVAQVRRDMRAADKDASMADSAVLVFIERERKIDMAKLRERMMTPLVAAAIHAGARSVRYGELWLVLQGGSVVTVLDKPKRLQHRMSKQHTRGRRPDHEREA